MARVKERIHDIRRDFIAGTLSVLLSAVVLLLVWYFLSSRFGYLDHPDLSEALKSSIFGRDQFNPEGVEKLQYVASLVIFPPLAYSLLALIRRALSGVNGRGLAIAYLATSLLAAGLIYALTGVDLKLGQLYPTDSVIASHPLMAVLLFLLLLAAMVLYRLKVEPSLPVLVKKTINVGLILAALFFVIALPARLLLNFASFVPYQASFHFNAYFYPISQVCLGRGLLVDFNSQYGLYPQFLEPVVDAIGLSTFNLFAIMAVLLAVSFLCFYFVLGKLVEDPVLRFTGMTAVLYFHYVVFEQVGDPYFQSFPHRIIFPGLLLVLSYLNFTRRSRPLYYFTFIIAAVSVLWNVESGAVVFLTWILARAYQDLLRHRGRSAAMAILKDVLVGILSLCGTFAVYALYTCLRYGGFPRFIDLASYQYYFYGLGFTMIPMTLVNTWNLVALAYAVGLVYAARALLVGDDSVKAKMVFTLSILGAGIFSYYQGRSHPQVLYTVLYPALMLIVIFADTLYARVLKGLRQKSIVPGEALILAVMLFFIVTSPFALAENYRMFLPGMDTPGQAPYPPGMIERNIAFIDDHVSPGEKVLILSYRSGMYYIGTHTASPLGIPAFIEMIDRSDMDKVVDFLRSDDARSRKVFVDTFFSNEMTDNDYVLQPLTDNYRIKDISADGNLIYYEKYRDDAPAIKRSCDVSSDASGTDRTLHYVYDDEKHAFFTPDKRFAAFMNGCGKPVLLNSSYSIELTLLPEKAQVPHAVVLYEMLPYLEGYGFTILRDSADPDMYSYEYGSGQGIIPALHFKLSDQHPNYLAITDDGTHLRAYVNGTLVSSYDKKLPLVIFPISLCIGNSVGLDCRFNGTIYELAISDRSLSAAEIAAKSRAGGP